MIDTTDRPRYQYRVGGLQVVEMRGLPADRPWTVFPDLDTIGVAGGLSEHDRRRALLAGLAEMVASAN